MSKSLKPLLFSAVCGSFVLAAASVASAAPLAVAVPQQDSFVESVRHFGPPPGKECIKWTRRFNTAHGFGHRRCIHWK